MAARITLRGERELASRLRTAERGLDNLAPTHRRAARTVAAASRGRAPKRTGRLTSSIGAHATRRAAVVTVAAEYAGPIHWGWPDRPQPARGWRGGPIHANPFVSAAAQNTEGGWVSLYHRTVERLLNGDAQL